MAKRKSQSTSLRPKSLPARSGGELVAAVAELRQLVRELRALLTDVTTFNRLLATAEEETGGSAQGAELPELAEVATVEDDTVYCPVAEVGPRAKGGA